MANDTPMMKQYRAIKERNQDSILFFRLGDFYEMFDEDAKTASRELDLMLTTRDRGREEHERTPMCGVPYHSAESYIARLIAKGYKVAICEQMEDPATAKGLVDRDIIRIITPGTRIDASMLDESKPNYLCSMYKNGANFALAFVELSTGEFVVTFFPTQDYDRMFSELCAYSPAEVIMNGEVSRNRVIGELIKQRLSALVQTMDERFEFYNACRLLTEQFGVKSAEDLPIGASQPAICAAGALLSYLADTQKVALGHINKIRVNSRGDFMELDIQTLRNLELVQSLKFGEKRGSLLWVLDKTVTPMGRRMIRSWVMRPLLSQAELMQRHTAVGELAEETVMRSEIRASLREVSDIERIISKIVYGTANGRDVKMLGVSIRGAQPMFRLIQNTKSGRLSVLKRADTLADLAELIEKTLVDEPPFSVREGGIIRSGVSEEVDYLRNLLEHSTDALAAIEAKERERMGKKVKIGYNHVFGYYIEIPRSMSDRVPDDYLRKQTLANSERFITQELKELESKLLTAKDSLAELEGKLFTELCTRLAAEVVRVQTTAAVIAEIDSICSFAQVASDNNYVRPVMDRSGIIDIKDGRHPVVEKMQKDTLFVPNDAYLDTDSHLVSIITGPNMAGKSTFMRQTALIVLMAQMGSFVPAREARIGIVDRVFTRIGASDDLAAGKSTFMVEMTEVADIVKNATPQSLILLDEVGRGTSTYDGMAIARAILEYCADKAALGAKTLFSTHYHELTELETVLPTVRNYKITAKRRGSDVIFLRKIVPGGADDSYGIDVARLAGVPEPITDRAREVLAQFASGAELPHIAPPDFSAEPEEREETELEKFGAMLADLDLGALTPIKALNMLYELKEKVQK